MKRNSVAMILIITMASTLFTGCGSSADEASKSNSDDSAGATAVSISKENVEADASGEGSVYYFNIQPEQDKEWQDLALAYTSETGVPVTVVTAESESLSAEMAKTDMPTLFQVDGPVELAVWKDYCMDLKNTELYSHVKSDDFVLKEGEEIKGVAYEIRTYGLIYNKTVLNAYFGMDGAKAKTVDEINSFAKLKEVADDIQSRLTEVSAAAGSKYDLQGAFASPGMDPSSVWKFAVQLANLPIYYEYKDKGIGMTEAIEGTYLDNYKNIFDLYITDSASEPTMVATKSDNDAITEFALGNAVFYQSGTWDYELILDAEFLTGIDLGMMPIYIGAKEEENQGLCTGSGSYWCINRKAPEENIKATEEFLKWVITSGTGRESISENMGLVTPFDTFDDGYTPANPLIREANDSIEAGKTAVSWNFSTIPSENWRNGVGSALTEYAQGTGEWDKVKSAFVEGWASEYELVRRQ